MKISHYLNVSGILWRFAKAAAALLFIVSVVFDVGAQGTSHTGISGTVVDQSGVPIIGAVVYASGTQSGGGVTDAEGRFALTAAPNATLTVSLIGYITQQVSVDNRTEINIVLVEDAQAIEDIVVVGFGTQKKETVTGAIGQISGQALLRSPVTNVSNALVGRVAGLSSIQKTGEAGYDQTTIRIRGVGTYAGGTSQDPLIVIDGIVRDMNAFNQIDPYDVQDVNVLKDASATAVYGVRGANGVVIVTTKRGKEGGLNISLTANYGFTRPTTLMSLVNSYDYATLRNEALLNDGQPDDFNEIFTADELTKFRINRDYLPSEVELMNLTPEQKMALNNSPAIYYGSHDYMKQIFDSSLSPLQQYNLNISGGTEKVAFFTSVGYQSQKSLTNDFGFKEIATNGGSNKYNFRTNFDFKIIPFTEINVSLAGQVRDTRAFTNRSGSYDGYDRYRDLLINVYEAPSFSGPGVYEGRRVNNYLGGTIMQNKGGWPGGPIDYIFQKEQARINESSLNTSIRVKHSMSYLLKGLSLRGTMSYDHYFRKVLSVTNRIPTYSFGRNPNDPAEILFVGGRKDPSSYSEGGWRKERKIYVDGGLDYVREFGKHDVTALALITGERRTAPDLRYEVPEGVYGIVGRVTYGYDDRYLAEFNIGYNGSENFAEGKRFGVFPAFSAGWVLSNESFFPKNDILTWVKFRGSYGQTGNAKIGGSRFLFLPGSWGSRGTSNPLENYYFGSSNGTVDNPVFTGKYESSTGNPDVTWEKKEAYNVAAELRFFRDRLSVTIDLFKESRSNILTTLETTPGIIGISGNALPPMNVGRMSNKGYEIEMSWKDNVGSDFWYNINGQVSYAVNKILYRAEPSYMYEWMNSTGFAYGQYKALYNEGFYNTPEEVANHPYNPVDGNVVHTGDLRIVDVNGDGTIDEKDVGPTGFSNVPRVTFSGGFTVGYKGFELTALVSGTTQGTTQMGGYLAFPFRQGNGTPISYMKNRWSQERYDAGEKIEYPRMSKNIENSQNGGNNSFWFRSTDHIKLKNIELGYSFSGAKWMRAAHIGSIRVYVNANNVATLWDRGLIEGIDPELAQDGGMTEGNIYPLTRVFNLGFNIQF